MTTRTAEGLMALLTALVSVGLMVKSAQLNIGWLEGRGPGSGAWPFWLSAGMLLVSLATLWRWFIRATPESRSLAPYITREGCVVVGTAVGALLFLLIGTHLVGLYASLLVFLFFSLRVMGGHGWITVLSLTFGVPVFVFCLFEWALKIPLPKSITEPLFYPVYDFIYSF